MAESAERTVDCDLLVAGSGAAGFAAALVAAHRGLRVILADKAPVLGGTTAWSGGWIWAPGNPVARRAGVPDEGDAPRRYLEAVLGNAFDPALVDAFLAAAPEMVDFLERHTALRFQPGLGIPDTYGDRPGAGTGGRSIIAEPYDARDLGSDLALLRPPLRETSFLGLTIQAGPDLRAFLSATRKPGSALHVARRLGRHLWDLALHGRGMQLRNGNALAARLLRSARDMGVELRPGHAVVRLLTGPEGVTGAVLLSDAGETTIRTTRGVVLATGGYPHDAARRDATFPRAEGHLTLAVPTATGDGLRLGEGAGGRQARHLAAAGAWCPVSQVTWPDGTTGTFPHIIDRGKPGVIGVLASGRRFCNEGLGYHDYVRDMLAAVPEGEAVASWLVCDRRFLRRYGLGIARPAPLPVRPWIRSGYVKTGQTLRELASSCGIDADGLAATVARFNDDARRGEDTEFQRGTTPYMRLQGDPEVGPNPCLAPIETPPYYAVRVVPGSFGTFAGLVTDAEARVLDERGAPIPGLYAAGTDMASVMGGHYPAGGINLGPALTFGFVAGRHAAGAAP
ncbi:FAD-dependent oxidoreductase [Silicimonas algicola]|uniref:Succinate dehydrogenase/fumarate reductase flavoprotein subunit n=1 Tax=Silicimonas algicola TaxID=1826607 RepID=A0A316GRF1_9RHOB|nr:FAD-dependent oxidoreductase [Silicimonas algicola]AZQ67981.1 FAD-dependent oxidoreductase [Silicimonas algicola]PWK57577.1 succinate dehydrogenase/fumarate reductase flavoprotein subunit [Silicimonas algicola]